MAKKTVNEALADLREKVKVRKELNKRYNELSVQKDKVATELRNSDYEYQEALREVGSAVMAEKDEVVSPTV